MQSAVKRFFEENKIEYYAFINYADCRIISDALMTRENFTPRSVIIFLIPYYVDTPSNMSAYASSKDYHIFVKRITNALGATLLREYPRCNYRGYGDHSPIDERHAAASAGLGILGDNGLLINEKYGTYTFVAELITDVEPSLLGCSPLQPVRRCIGCGACRCACPTGTLTSHSCECLSATTQKKGTLTQNEVDLMRKVNTVWGCDICQRVCPYNDNVCLTPIPFFYEDRLASLTKEYVLSLSKERFAERAFAWRGRNTVLRNLEILEK